MSEPSQKVSVNAGFSQVASDSTVYDFNDLPPLSPMEARRQGVKDY